MQELKFHPAANIFPMMSDEEYANLLADIREHGQREPIYTHGGQIIDGRNRYKACVALGISPRVQEWDGRGSLVSFIVSLNLHRRHLTSSQRAAVAVDILPMLEEEAKERQRKAGETYGRGKVPEKIPEANGEESRDQAATITGSNPHYVSDAKRIKEESPELFEKVRAGELTITQAKREAIRENAKEAPPLPSHKYRVVYADPPWSYGNTQPDYHPEQRDHYPTMSMGEICALPIKDIVEDNAVLFLWVTSPILEESFQVVHAWGFKYKTSFVWDKIKHNMGHYNSVRHELLLVCVRGSCQPDVLKLFDSVVSIERTDHSSKPEHFREIIDTIYPHGRRIELFARRATEGWDVYGNE